MRAQQHVLVGQVGSGDGGHDVESGHVAQEFGLRVQADARALVPRCEPVEQGVVLARQMQRGDLAGGGGEDLVHAPAPGPVAGDQPEGAGALQPLRACVGDERELIAGLPFRHRCFPRFGHALEGLRGGVVEPRLVLAAGRFGEGDCDELALGRRQPGVQLGSVGEVGQRDHLTLHGPVGAGAPGEQRALERPSAGLHHVDVGKAALPSDPGAVLLPLRLDAPALVVGDQPVRGPRVGRRAHQPWADGVEQGLREVEGLASRAHALFPHRLDDGVVGREGLGGQRRGQGKGGCGEKNASCSHEMGFLLEFGARGKSLGRPEVHREGSAPSGWDTGGECASNRMKMRSGTAGDSK